MLEGVDVDNLHGLGSTHGFANVRRIPNHDHMSADEHSVQQALHNTFWGDSGADGTIAPQGHSTPHPTSSVLGVPLVHELGANDAVTPHIEFRPAGMMRDADDDDLNPKHAIVLPPTSVTPRTLIRNMAQAASPTQKPLTPRAPERNGSAAMDSSDMVLTPVARPNPQRENVIHLPGHPEVPAGLVYDPELLQEYRNLFGREQDMDDTTHAASREDLSAHKQQIFRELALKKNALQELHESLNQKLTAGTPSDNTVVDTSQLSSAAHSAAVSAVTQPQQVVRGTYVDDVPHKHTMTGAASQASIVTPDPKGGLSASPAAGSRGYMGGSNVSSSVSSSGASKASTPRASILKAFDGEGTTEPEEFQRIPPAELAAFHEFRAKHFYSTNNLGESKYFPGRADNVTAAKFKFRKYLTPPTPTPTPNNSSFVHREYTHADGLELLDQIDNDALSRSSSSIYSTYGDADAGARALVDEYAGQQDLDHQIVREDYPMTPPIATSSRLFSPIGHRTPVQSAESSFRSSDFESTDHASVSVDDVEAAAAPGYVSPSERARHFEILKNAPTHYNDDFANAIRATIEDPDLTEREVIDQVMMLHEGFKAFGGETQLQKRAREAASAATAAQPTAESEFLTDLSEPTKGSAYAQTTPTSQDVNHIPDRWQPQQTPLTVSSDTVIHQPDLASLGDQTILEHNLNDDNTIVPADVFNDASLQGAFIHRSPFTPLAGLEGLRVHTRTHFKDEYLDSGDLDDFPRDLGVPRKPQREYHLRRALDQNVHKRIRQMVTDLSRSPAVLAGGAYDPTADDLHAANVESAGALLTTLRKHEEVNQMHHDDQVETAHKGQLSGKYFGAHLSTKNEFSDVGGRNTFARRRFLYEKQERLAHAAEQADREYRGADNLTHSKEHISILKLRRSLYREGSQLNLEHLKRDDKARRDFEADSQVPSIHAAKMRQDFPVIAQQLLQHTAITKAAASAAVAAAPPATHTFIGLPPPNIAKQLSVVQASAQRTAARTRPNLTYELAGTTIHTVRARHEIDTEGARQDRLAAQAKTSAERVARQAQLDQEFAESRAKLLANVEAFQARHPTIDLSHLKERLSPKK